jgi:hypothetical protein
LESIERHYRVDRHQIHFLRFLLEAYEGVAVLSTLDRTAGLVALRIAPGREMEAEALITGLCGQMMIEPLPTLADER